MKDIMSRLLDDNESVSRADCITEIGNLRLARAGLLEILERVDWWLSTDNEGGPIRNIVRQAITKWRPPG